ncbi:LCP family protein [Parablautia muri]|nr:LCP family protein [Parablautia muri]
MKRYEKRRRKSGFKKVIIFLLVFLLVLLGGWYYIVGRLYEKMNYLEAEDYRTQPWKKDGVVNILLIGNDSRENGEDGRSDAMILLSLSDKTKSIYMTSILRDIYVDIPGHDGNRLNAAYAFGGPELLMETIQQNFGIDVNRYVLVNFEAFAALVDAVNGVELELSGQEIEYVNAYLVEYNMLTNRAEGTDYMDTGASGMVHLNGPQALAYSRNRYMGTDFGRTERQRKVLGAVIEKLPTAVLSGPEKIVNGILPNLTTNLTKEECFRLSLQAGKFLLYDNNQGSIPLEGTYTPAEIRGMAVLEIDFEKNKNWLREHIYHDMEN